MDFSISLIQLSQDSALYILRGHIINFQPNIVFLSLKVDIVPANIADFDEMPHYAVFYQGHYCLRK